MGVARPAALAAAGATREAEAVQDRAATEEAIVSVGARVARVRSTLRATFAAASCTAGKAPYLPCRVDRPGDV